MSILAVPSSPTWRVSFVTNRGLVKRYNEDALCFGHQVIQKDMVAPSSDLLRVGDPPLFLIADGLGGHDRGDFVSRFVAFELGFRASDIQDETDLRSVLESINQDIYGFIAGVNQAKPMGTTVAGVVFSSNSLLVFNVGDSRIYQVGTVLTQLSVDDREFGGSSDRITRSLGGTSLPETLAPHISVHPLENSVRILLCSDGLTDLVSDEDIHVAFQDNVGAAVSTLFELTLLAGGTDNISIMAIEEASSP